MPTSQLATRLCSLTCILVVCRFCFDKWQKRSPPSPTCPPHSGAVLLGGEKPGVVLMPPNYLALSKCHPAPLPISPYTSQVSPTPDSRCLTPPHPQALCILVLPLLLLLLSFFVLTCCTHAHTHTYSRISPPSNHISRL